MTFCTRCGTKLAEAATFCGGCGTVVAGSSTQFSQASMVSAAVKTGAKFVIKGLFVLYVLAFLLVGCVVVVLMENAPS